MTIKELIKNAGLKALSTFEDRETKGVFVSDMISDVMTNVESGNIWLTIQTHKSIIPAANLVDVSAIVITSGKEVPEDTVELANKYGIAVLSSELLTFELVGKLYELGFGGK